MKTVSVALTLLLCLAAAGCASTPRFEAYPDASRSSSYAAPTHNNTPGQPWHSEGEQYPRIVFPF